MTAPFLVLLLALATSSARASEYADKAQTLIDDAEYAEAAKVLRDGLSRPSLERAELVELYRLQGTVMVALGRQQRAEAAFRNLIVADPGFELPRGVSPKVREVFEAVHKELVDQGGLDQAFKPQHTPVGSVASGKDVALRFAVGERSRVGQVVRVQVYYRRLGTPHYASIDASSAGDGSYAGVVPGFFLDADSEDYAVEYYIEAADGGGARLTGVGTPKLPLQFEVLGSQPATGGGGGGQPVAEDNTLWVALGIAAGGVAVVGIGAGVVAYLLLSQKGTGTATVTLQKAP